MPSKRNTQTLHTFDEWKLLDKSRKGRLATKRITESQYRAHKRGMETFAKLFIISFLGFILGGLLYSSKMTVIGDVAYGLSAILVFVGLFILLQSRNRYMST